MVYLFSDLRISCYRNLEEIERIKHFLSFETTRAIDMPSLQNRVLEQGVLQNSRTVNILVVIETSKKLLFQKLTKNMMENWSTGKNIGKQECSAENEVQQKLWQGVCRRVSTLINCFDHHLFNFYILLKKKIKKC